MRILTNTVAALLLCLSFSFVAKADAISPDKLWTRDNIMTLLNSHPQAKADLAGRDLDTFFKDRDKAPELANCRAALSLVTGVYRTTYKQAQNSASAADKAKNWQAVQAIVEGSSSLVSLPDALGAEPEALVPLLQKCGPCIAYVDHVDGGGTFEYQSIVACHSTKATPDQRTAAFNSNSDYLLRLPNYVNDFGSVLAFEGRSSDGQTPLDASLVNPIQSSPFTAFIAVRGLAGYAFGYLGDCTYLKRTDNFVLQFNSSKELNYNQTDTIPDPKLGGNISTYYLKTVDGGWFTDGDTFYQTHANFSEIQSAALEVLEAATFFTGDKPITDYATNVIMMSGFTMHDKNYPGDIS